MTMKDITHISSPPRREAMVNQNPTPTDVAGDRRGTRAVRTAAMATIAALVATTLAACAVGPNYKRPNTPVAQQFTGAEPSTYQTAQETPVQFWKQFDDETLDQLVSDALTANHDLRIALGHLVEARAARHESMYDLAPTVTASAGHTNELLPKVQAGFPLTTSYYDAGFDATWELDLFGRVR